MFISGENLEELHELLEGGLLDDDEDFNRVLESATTVEENVEGKKVYVCEICGKECVSSEEVWRGMKPSSILEKVHPKSKKNQRKLFHQLYRLVSFKKL